jgi:hypothetical protein
MSRTSLPVTSITVDAASGGAGVDQQINPSAEF